MGPHSGGRFLAVSQVVCKAHLLKVQLRQQNRARYFHRQRTVTQPFTLLLEVYNQYVKQWVEEP